MYHNVSQYVDEPSAFWVNYHDNDEIAASITGFFTAGLQEGSTEGYNPRTSIAQAFYKVEDFPKMMDHIADSMTNAVHQGRKSTTLIGSVQVVEQRIHVRWPWLILPAPLVLCSMLFLAASIIFAAERHKAVWKSSTIPTLFHGLSGWDDNDLRDIDMAGMERRAKFMRVSLQPSTNGVLRLVRESNVIKHEVRLHSE